MFVSAENMKDDGWKHFKERSSEPGVVYNCNRTTAKQLTRQGGAMFIDAVSLEDSRRVEAIFYMVSEDPSALQRAQTAKHNLAAAGHNVPLVAFDPSHPTFPFSILVA